MTESAVTDRGEGPVDDGVYRVETLNLDLPAVVGALSQQLHEAGLPVTPERASHFAEALALTKPESRRRLYWIARAIFVTGQLQVAIFDLVFFTIFGATDVSDDFEADELVPINTPADEREKADHKSQEMENPREQDPRTMDVSSSPPGDDGDDEDDDGEEVEIPLAMASQEELLGKKSFDLLAPHELAQLYRLMTRLELATPLRRTRRTKKGRHGEHMDMRRTLRASLRTGGDPIKLKRRHRRVVRRRLVLMCDISGSMEPYARAYLQFLTAAGSSGPNAEAFVFATRLTRLTRALAGRNPERAIQRAAAAAPDWSSGTRIGDALKTFNDRHGRRGMARGAVVVILSDGWELGDPELVAQEMERLARLTYRIVWVNPRVSAGGFSPQAGGMLAALPFCDALVSGHSLDALGEVAEAIRAPLWTGDGPPQWKPATPPPADENEEEAWGSAIPVQGSSVAMPSGHAPRRGRTTAGWKDEREK
ncbi:MAG: VWA domain-containing protein [Actinobacteria bacterium]|nr:VWA domain-containing protein [Actinomycetota bacterium]